MNILMMTNTYLPHVGGVARSVDAFSRAYEARGHRVLVVAPEFPDMPEHERGVVRIPALQNFNGSDFSVVLPVSGHLERAVQAFEPDVIHSHHPFLVGATARRLASWLSRPLVFTHHTMYEQYTHYVPGDSEALKRFVVQLSTSYANLCDLVFAPSASIASILSHRGVVTPIQVVPTGIATERFAAGDRAAGRRRWRLPADATVIGHVGRLAPEKNLDLLAEAVARLLEQRPQAHFLVVGSGPSEADIARACARRGVRERLHFTGKLGLPALADAYRAMDVFGFTSLSETQGLVLAEAMAAGLPVVALDAPGAREVVADGENGRLLLATATAGQFADALAGVLDAPAAERARRDRAMTETAERYSLAACADAALGHYHRLEEAGAVDEAERDAWQTSLRRIRAEWNLLKGMAHAAGAAARTRDEDSRDALS